MWLLPISLLIVRPLLVRNALDGKDIEAALHCFRGAFEDVKAKENRATLVVLARIIEGRGAGAWARGRRDLALRGSSFAALGSICFERSAAFPSDLGLTPSGAHRTIRSSGENGRNLLPCFALPVGLDESEILFC